MKKHLWLLLGAHQRGFSFWSRGRSTISAFPSLICCLLGTGLSCDETIDHSPSASGCGKPEAVSELLLQEDPKGINLEPAFRAFSFFPHPKMFWGSFALSPGGIWGFGGAPSRCSGANPWGDELWGLL